MKLRKKEGRPFVRRQEAFGKILLDRPGAPAHPGKGAAPGYGGRHRRPPTRPQGPTGPSRSRLRSLKTAMALRGALYSFPGPAPFPLVDGFTEVPGQEGWPFD